MPSNGMAVAALIIAIIALVAIIIFVIIWFVTKDNKSVSKNWSIFTGTTSNTTDNFTPSPNSVYQVSRIGLSSLLIGNNSNEVGAQFIVDNTKNTSSLSVRGDTGISIIDNINAGTVSANSSALYYWTADKTATRLY